MIQMTNGDKVNVIQWVDLVKDKKVLADSKDDTRKTMMYCADSSEKQITQTI